MTNSAVGTTSTFEVGLAETHSTFGGTLQDGEGILALVKGGAGEFILTGSNTYTSGTTLREGILTLGSADAVGSEGAITFAGGVLRYTDANTTDYPARFSDEAHQVFRIDTNGQDVTFANDINLGNGLSWDTSQLESSGIVTVVPEPSTLAMLLGLGVFAACHRWRRVR